MVLVQIYGRGGSPRIGQSFKYCFNFYKDLEEAKECCQLMTEDTLIISKLK